LLGTRPVRRGVERGVAVAPASVSRGFPLVDSLTTEPSLAAIACYRACAGGSLNVILDSL